LSPCPVINTDVNGTVEEKPMKFPVLNPGNGLKKLPMTSPALVVAV
jgi:hypothetical protein